MPRTKEDDSVATSIARTMPVVTGLRCETCGALHDASNDTFIVIAGDIMIGTSKAVYGSNLDDKGKLVHSTVLCRKVSCCKQLLDSIEVVVTQTRATAK